MFSHLRRPADGEVSDQIVPGRFSSEECRKRTVDAQVLQAPHQMAEAHYAAGQI
jgi:hypothetical protein